MSSHFPPQTQDILVLLHVWSEHHETCIETWIHYTRSGARCSSKVTWNIKQLIDIRHQHVISIDINDFGKLGVVPSVESSMCTLNFCPSSKCTIVNRVIFGLKPITVHCLDYAGVPANFLKSPMCLRGQRVRNQGYHIPLARKCLDGETKHQCRNSKFVVDDNCKPCYIVFSRCKIFFAPFLAKAAFNLIHSPFLESKLKLIFKKPFLITHNILQDIVRYFKVIRRRNWSPRQKKTHHDYHAQ